MSNIQKQHKISPAIAWLTIQKFIIFYCPLDGEHTTGMDVPDGGFFYSVRKFYERGASMSDFVDGPNSAGPHYTFSA